MRQIFIFSAVSLLIINLNALAVSKPDLRKFDGNTSLGLTVNTGNTNSKNVNVGANLHYRPNKKWQNKLGFQGQLNSNNNTRTAEKYTLTGETNYFFSPRNFLYATGQVRQDKFSPYTYEFNESIGYGRRLFSWYTLTLDGKIGPGLRQARARDTGQHEHEVTLYTQADLEWKITKASTFSQVVTVQAGHPNTHLEAVSALTTKIIGNLGTQISYTVDHDTYIPPGSSHTKRTDTTTNIALVYSF